MKNHAISVSLRQREVLELMAFGYSSKQIALILKIAEVTIIGYKKRLMEKFDVKNSNELIYLASKLGII